MSFIIAVGNQKGGVAKTTTCVSLGAALVERGLEVLAIDLDPQANLSLALGVNSRTVRRSAADVLLGNHTPVSVSRETSMPGLDIIPASQDLNLVEKFLAVRPNYEYALRQALTHAASYQVILCDCPPSLGIIPIIAYTAADLLLVPTQCEYFSAHGLSEVFDLVRKVRERTNPRLSYRILVTMFDRRNRVHHTLLGHLRAAFGDAVLQTTIEVDTKLRESPVVGQPIMSYASKSRGALQYRALAEELSCYVKQETAAQPA